MIGTEKTNNDNDKMKHNPRTIEPVISVDLVNSICHVFLFKTDIKSSL